MGLYAHFLATCPGLERLRAAKGRPTHELVGQKNVCLLKNMGLYAYLFAACTGSEKLNADQHRPTSESVGHKIKV